MIGISCDCVVCFSVNFDLGHSCFCRLLQCCFLRKETLLLACVAGSFVGERMCEREFREILSLAHATMLAGLLL